MNPDKHQRRKQKLQRFVWFFAHTLCMSSVTKTFLLVSFSVRSKQLLCFEYDQGQKGEQKHTNFETLLSFKTISLYHLC